MSFDNYLDANAVKEKEEENFQKFLASIRSKQVKDQKLTVSKVMQDIRDNQKLIDGGKK